MKQLTSFYVLFKESEDKYRKWGEGDVEEGQVHPVVQRLRGVAVEEGVEELGSESGNVFVEEILESKFNKFQDFYRSKYPSVINNQWTQSLVSVQ